LSVVVVSMEGRRKRRAREKNLTYIAALVRQA